MPHEGLSGRLLISTLRRWGHLQEGWVRIPAASGPEHEKVFHAVAEIVSRSGLEIMGQGSAPTAKQAISDAADDAVRQLLEAEPHNPLRRPGRRRREG